MSNEELSNEQVETSLAPEPTNEHTLDLVESQEYATCADETETAEAVPETTESVHEASEHVLSELKPIFTAFQEKLDALSGQIDFGIKFADKKINERVDKLYEENRVYKDNLVEQFKKKLVLGVIEQIDVADKQISYFEMSEESEKNYQSLMRAFREITDDFREMLNNRLDIIPFQSCPGDKFNAVRHNVLGTIPDGDKDKDKTIAISKRYGYANIDGIVLRPELVDVFYFDSSLATPEVTASSFLPPEGTEKHTET